MKRLQTILVAGIIFLFFVIDVSAQAPTTPPPVTSLARYATCDACGLCPNIVNGKSPSCTVDIVPEDWKNCAKCLYPNLYPSGSTPDPYECATLLIDDTTNLAKNPVKAGRQFTGLGCITAGTGVGFQDGAPSVVQAMLNVIFGLSGGIAFIYLMYGGFIYMTSQADPEQLNYGRRLITGAIVGLIITFGSVFLVNLIGSGILKIPGMSGVTSP